MPRCQLHRKHYSIYSAHIQEHHAYTKKCDATACVGKAAASSRMGVLARSDNAIATDATHNQREPEVSFIFTV